MCVKMNIYIGRGLQWESLYDRGHGLSRVTGRYGRYQLPHTFDVPILNVTHFYILNSVRFVRGIFNSNGA